MKKFISIILCAVLAFGCVVPASCAQAADDSYADALTVEPEYPIVVVRGMDFTGLTKNIDTDEAQAAIKSIDFETVAKTVLNFIWKGITTLSLDNAMGSVIDLVRGILGDLACDRQGGSLYNVTTKTYPLAVSNYPELYDVESAGNEYGMVKTLSDRYGAENVYFYVYDWRLDPYEMADNLDDMITLAINEHPGCSKVNLICASMGGMQTTVYMAKHGYNKLNRVLFMSAAFCGAYVPTDMFQGKVLISEETLLNYVRYLVRDNSTYTAFVNIASKLGVFKLAENLAGRFVSRYSEIAYNELLLDTFGTMPGFWALVLVDEYDECMKYMFSGKETEYSGIIAKAERLHKIALDRENMLESAVKDGVEVAVVANYNIPLIPVYERACANGDGTLETEPMSGFAKVAEYGKTLDVSAGKYISPDFVIDATNCMFPDSTWFVKGAPHVSCSSGTDYADFMLWLLECEGQPTIESNKIYPQFLSSDTFQSISVLK